MFNKQNFCHVASNNRNDQKAGMFLYKTTDDLETVSASGYFNDKIIDINLHDLIIHEYHNPADRTDVQTNILCVIERTLDNIGTDVVLSQFEGEVETDLTEIFEALNGKVNIDGTSIMTAPLKMKAGSMRGAVGPYLNGVSFWDMDSQGTITRIATISYSQFLPAQNSTMSLGSSSYKWKTLYIGALNNGFDIAVPVTNSADTLALKSQVDLAANSGRMITAQGLWYAKMDSATVPPAAEDGTNYADFSQTDQEGNPIIVTYTRTSGAWVQDQTITPPAGYDGYIPITSKIWDIPEQDGQQGGRVLWNHQSKEFTPYPMIVSFDSIQVTGDSTVAMPVNPSSTQIVNKNYVDTAIASIPTPTINAIQSIDASIVGTLTQNESVFSGFSSSNYLTLPGPFDFSNTFELVIGAKFTAGTDHQAVVIFDSKGGGVSWQPAIVYKNSGELEFNSSVGSIAISGSVSTGVDYLIKLTWDGTDYRLYTSTDNGATYTQVGSAFTSSQDLGTFTYVSIAKTPSAATFEDYLGTIDIEQAYIKYGENKVWSGLGSPGLHQRVAVGHEVIAFQAPTAQNNYTWYRKYADGWVEQGGIYDNGSQSSSIDATINLPVTMINTNYCAYVTAGDTNDILQYLKDGNLVALNRQTTSFHAYYISNGGSNGTIGKIFWEVKGIAAS